MYQYEDLLSIATDTYGVNVTEKVFRSNAKGLCKGNRIGISLKLNTDSEKACVLAEELGHYITNHGNIIDLRSVVNQKQELRARVWAHQKLVLIDDLISAYKHGCRNQFEIADFLNVTETFLSEALNTLSSKHGIFVVKGQFAVYFDPLSILEMCELTEALETSY